MHRVRIDPLACALLLAARCAAGLGPAAGPPARSTPLNEVTFVAFDIETTGLSRAHDRIVEIGAVKFRAGKRLEARSWLVNPDGPIPAAAQRIHGITPDMVADAPRFEQIGPAFEAFVQGTVLIAHNAPFDHAFLAAEYARCRAAPRACPVLDSLRLSRQWFPGLERYALQPLARELNIPFTGPHRALADAACVEAVFLAGLRAAPQFQTLGDLLDAGAL
ncbi:MAG: 3'-5' exonuclease [Kiritimatiellae bacterium]|nr:3'-5' exonuclease [Kiritimatiellia bacterium]